MFGIKGGLLAGGLLAVAASGIGGYFLGRDAGKDDVVSAWRAETIKEQADLIAYQKEIRGIIVGLQRENADISERVRVEYVDKVNTITQTRYENRDVIKEVFRETPYLSTGWVYAHNQLVDGLPIDATRAADRSPSTFTESDSLRVINENYSVARQAIARDKAWNSFYDQTYNNYRLPSSGSVQNADTAGSSELTESSR